MQYSQRAARLVKEFEGFSATPYQCPAGRMTIAYGHSNTPSLKQVTVAEANIILDRDLTVLSVYLNQKIGVSLTQGQFDALCSLIYNWGAGKFYRSKGLVLLNQGKYKLAAKEFFSKERGVVNISGKFSNGLYRRRCAEFKLWNKGANQ